jgi:hypothetical protein
MNMLKRNYEKWISITLFVCVAVFMVISFISVGDQNSEEQLHIQKRAIENAAVLCYALEGAYPPDIAYLEERYGLVVNRSKFIVRYDAFASNVKPEIAVYHTFNSGGGVGR